MNKICTRCNKEKSVSDFFKRNTSEKKDGLRSHCKECIFKKSHSYYIKNQEKYKALNRIWYKENIEQQKAYNYSRRDKSRDYHLKKLYGMSSTDYIVMLQKQNGQCAICFQFPNDKKPLAVDHCHKTGKIRGLLCTRCNLSIGALNDDPLLLESAIKYLNI